MSLPKSSSGGRDDFASSETWAMHYQSIDPTQEPNADRFAWATALLPLLDHTRIIPAADWRRTAGGATLEVA